MKGQCQVLNMCRVGNKKELLRQKQPLYSFIQNKCFLLMVSLIFRCIVYATDST